MDFGISTGFWIQSLTNIESQINFNQEVINTISPQRFKKKYLERNTCFSCIAHSESANIYWVLSLSQVLC